jgi:hypothetical protein
VALQRAGGEAGCPLEVMEWTPPGDSAGICVPESPV